jgi:hypothetical protein
MSKAKAKKPVLKEFSVEVRRTLVEAVFIKVKAKNKADATDKANDYLVENDAASLDYEFCGDDCDVYAVTEIPPRLCKSSVF